ncbi:MULTISPECIES: AraC family transcriptional regulator [Methylococcus]|uniref:AraC family transcriptional regulator, positive regulator of tynA and feaB n=1 Tax=Methylococcus capsulatus TaxID=414 RepID=A0AA35UKK7_METCP|nr:AraC family transcriptional regulator [Methylococcus capsulatus]CAI8805168.1 AraC family transcriptional regulator, positive regulator of tynA and feaB [Methylococcus capsulatus]
MGSLLVFSSHQLPERDRFDLWRETASVGPGAVDVAHVDRRPFFGRVEWLPLGKIDAYRVSFSAATFTRSRRWIEWDGFDGFCFHINLNGRSETSRHRSRTVLDGFSATGHSYGQPFEAALVPAPGRYCESLNLVIPREEMLHKAPHAERCIGTLHADQPPLRLLSQYLIMLGNTPAEDSQLNQLAGNHVLDLLALLLGPTLDAEHEAKLHGLRAARLAALKRYLHDHHHHPKLSVTMAARALNISERYLHDLIAETGESFTEMVNRLRLERARRLLCDPKHRHLRIGEVAFTSGFNDLSYFNRLFRRRFGETPGTFKAEAHRDRDAFHSPDAMEIGHD